MGIANRLQGTLDKLLTKFNVTDKDVYKRSRTRTGGDPVTGAGQISTHVDSLVVPPPQIEYYGVNSFREVKYNPAVLSAAGLAVVGDILCTMSSTSMSADELANPNTTLVLKADKYEDERAVVTFVPLSIEGAALAYIVVLRSVKRSS